MTTTFGAMPPIGRPADGEDGSILPALWQRERDGARTDLTLGDVHRFDTLPAATDAGRQSTHSMYAISAPSPCRGPSFTIRV